MKKIIKLSIAVLVTAISIQAESKLISYELSGDKDPRVETENRGVIFGNCTFDENGERNSPCWRPVFIKISALNEKEKKEFLESVQLVLTNELAINPRTGKVSGFAAHLRNGDTPFEKYHKEENLVREFGNNSDSYKIGAINVTESGDFLYLPVGHINGLVAIKCKFFENGEIKEGSSSFSLNYSLARKNNNSSAGNYAISNSNQRGNCSVRYGDTSEMFAPTSLADRMRMMDNE